MATLFEEFKSLFVLEYLTKLHFGAGGEAADLAAGLKRLLADANTADVIMSKNEELEDVSTSSLLFTLIPFAIGDVLYTYSKFNRETRLGLLSEVEQVWSKFLQMMTQLQVVQKKDKNQDPRSIKIAAVKRQDVLRPDVKSVLMYLSTSSIDLDEIREQVIDTMEYFTIQCENDIRFVYEEKTILEMMPAALECTESVPAKKPWSMKLDKSQVRTLVRSQVFRPDIVMPTMTLDEFARLEMAAMRDSSENNFNKTLNDDSNYQEQETNEENQTLKDRAWDDWKDSNPRGSGNKMTNVG